MRLTRRFRQFGNAQLAAHVASVSIVRQNCRAKQSLTQELAAASSDPPAFRKQRTVLYFSAVAASADSVPAELRCVA